jgi:lipopolysaccharide export system permease protein
MTRTLDRYVTREFLRLFMLFAMAAPLLFVLGDWTDNIDRYTERGIPVARVALAYVYQLPLFILYSLPIAALIATVFTVSNMTRHAELTAAKAGGVSFYRVILPLPFLGLFFALVGLGLSEVVPVTLARKAELLGETQFRQGSRAQFVYRSAHGDIYAVRQLDVGAGRIYGMTMEREGDGRTLASYHAIAREAVHTPGEGWTLLDGHLRVFPDEDVEQTFRFRELRPRRFTETPEQLLAVPKDPEEMRYAELARFIEIIERSGGEPLKQKVRLAQKIAIPAATLIIVLFGAPLANTSARGGPAYGIGISLGITIVYLMLFRVAEAAGVAGALPTTVAAWVPNLIFALWAGVLLVRVRT